MLAGILIAAILVVGLWYALPWIGEQRQSPGELADEPDERFSESMRILKRDVIEFGDPSVVSTPLTRASEFYGLHMSARRAARRRLTVLAVLFAAAVVLAVLAGLSIVPWWTIAIPGGLATVFLGIARVTVVQMHRRLDAYAAGLDAGFREDEDTTRIELVEEQALSSEFSIDLSAPADRGVFWDPVPVTAATYVQQPLVPRTVRTIDLSAPVVADTPFVPTADHPDDAPEEHSTLLPRVVGE